MVLESRKKNHRNCCRVLESWIQDIKKWQVILEKGIEVNIQVSCKTNKQSKLMLDE